MKGEGRGRGQRDEGVSDDAAGLLGADDVGVAAGGEVARDDRPGIIDEDTFGLGAAAVDADFVGHEDKLVETEITEETQRSQNRKSRLAR